MVAERHVNLRYNMLDSHKDSQLSNGGIAWWYIQHYYSNQCNSSSLPGVQQFQVECLDINWCVAQQVILRNFHQREIHDNTNRITIGINGAFSDDENTGEKDEKVCSTPHGSCGNQDRWILTGLQGVWRRNAWKEWTWLLEPCWLATPWRKANEKEEDVVSRVGV